MKRNLVVLMIICLMIFACEQKHKIDLDTISIGDDKKVVILSFGNPDQEEYRNLLGISKYTLIWKRGNTKYKIDFINDQVVYKEKVKSTGLFN